MSTSSRWPPWSVQAQNFSMTQAHSAAGGVGQGVPNGLGSGGVLLGVAAVPFAGVFQRGQRGSFAVGEVAEGGRVGGCQRRGEMDADRMLRVVLGEEGADAGAPVAALRPVAGVAEPAHQLRPGTCGPLDSPARRGGLATETVPGQRRAYHVERIRRLPAVRCRVGERRDHLHELDHRAGPHRYACCPRGPAEASLPTLGPQAESWRPAVPRGLVLARRTLRTPPGLFWESRNIVRELLPPDGGVRKELQNR